MRANRTKRKSSVVGLSVHNNDKGLCNLDYNNHFHKNDDNDIVIDVAKFSCDNISFRCISNLTKKFLSYLDFYDPRLWRPTSTSTSTPKPRARHRARHRRKHRSRLRRKKCQKK